MSDDKNTSSDHTPPTWVVSPWRVSCSPRDDGDDQCELYAGDMSLEILFPEPQRGMYDYIVKCVNMHDELVSALEAILPYAENESEALSELRDSDEAQEEAERAYSAINKAQAVLAKN